MNVCLVTLSHSKADNAHYFCGIDLSDQPNSDKKAKGLLQGIITSVRQGDQVENPDSRISIKTLEARDLLGKHAVCIQGLATSDDPQFTCFFWEFAQLTNGWEGLMGTVANSCVGGGRERLIHWEGGAGRYYRHAQALKAEGRLGGWKSGTEARGKMGVLVSQMSTMPVTIYSGEFYDHNASVLVADDARKLAAIWVFATSPEFVAEVRKLDRSLKPSNNIFIKVHFDLAKWKKIAAEKYPNGLPKPHSDDPTQWLFNGHPKGSEQPLQVAVARLLGYRWPRQTGSEFPDCPALGVDGLVSYADADGIVCLPPINREQPAAARLRNLLAAAFGLDWSPSRERDLLAATGAKQTNLEDWLRDALFEQHCKLFKNRPFIWHLWDGRKDGFHALVNYHRLDHATLQKLTYSYLGDWIRQQDADAKADKPGAAERLGAARALETELINILEGKPPYDIFIRWKPIREQPLGWQPDLNDGVRLNIRPFMNANDVGRKGAGILRFKPNIKWDKDRGKEPYRDKADYPWFWHTEEPPLSCPGGPDFTGHRWNNVDLTLARKRAVRNNGG